jgi:hypothetical protein
MTRDEILKMEAGAELDALIAEKVMEWHLVIDNDGWKHWDDKDNHFAAGINQDEESKIYEDEEDLHILHFHPSMSILWAWEVVEKLIELGETITLKYEKEFTGKGMAWYLYTTKGAGWSYDTFSETPQLAICRAALIAMMEVQDGWTD